tara:strand:+ start:110 stop:1267 length:1158 start_codon:yes stop_codon:yes gene_type:complete
MTAFGKGWELMKGIIFNGKEYDDIDDLDPIIQGILDDYTQGTTLPALPWSGGGKRKGTPWTRMFKEGSSAPLHRLKGFTHPEQEMLPTVVHWEGGKTSIMPQFRALTKPLGGRFIPAELFGGSGSFILGMNDPQARGLYADLNPDMTNLMTQLKRGMGDVNIAQDQDDLERMVAELNEIRYRRDVMGQQLDDDDLMRMAHLLVGANLANRNGMFTYKPWDKEPQTYTEGKIQRPSFRVQPKRVMPNDVGSINLDPYASRLQNVEIRTGDLRETSQALTPRHLAFWDPPYITRDISYGGSSQQMEGKTFDQLQRDTLELIGEHKGPSILSNYLYDKNTRKPNREYINAVLDQEMQIHPWIRKPKSNKQPQVELIATKNFPQQKTLF